MKKIWILCLLFMGCSSFAATIPQTITFNSDASEGNVVRLTATATSGLPVSFSIVSGPGVINPSSTGQILSFSGSDPVVVQADQAGDATYLAATAVQKTFQARFATQTFIYAGPDKRNDSLGDYFYYPALNPVAVDAAGNVYMVGTSDTVQAYPANNFDLLTTKYDKNGALIWSKKFDGSGQGDDGGNSVLLDGNNVYVCGWSTLAGGPNRDLIVFKYDTDGNLSSSWADNGNGAGVRTYRGAGTGNNEGRLMALASNGDLIISGIQSGAASQNLVVIRLDSTGAFSNVWADKGDSINTQGVRVYDGTAATADDLYAMTVSSAGDVYLCGYSTETHTTGGNNQDGVVVKYLADGTQAWVYKYDTPVTGLNDNFTAIGLDSQNNVLVTGWSLVTALDGDYVTVKLDPSGGVVWASRFNDSRNVDDRAYALAIGKDDSVFVAGYANWDQESDDGVTVKYDKDGNEVQQIRQRSEQAFFGPGKQWYRDGIAILLDSAGNIYNLNYAYDGAQSDYLLTKYDPAGEQLWSARYNSGSTAMRDDPHMLLLGPDGSIYMGGTSQLSNGMGGTTQDLLVVRISQNGPAVTSGPTAAPNPVTVGQAVTLSVAATDGATYTWNFGDGTSGSGASVQHTYSPAGTYQATVTINSDFGTTSTANVSVTVQPVGFGQTGVAIDSDGDGFSDELETALGTNASSATSTPAGGAPAGEAQAIADSKVAIKLSFSKQNSDSIGVSGTILLQSSATVDGAFTLSVGGVVQTFTLVKGAAKTAAGAVKVSAKGTSDRTAKFSAKLMKGSFAATLADEGLTDTTVKAKDVTIPVTLYYNSTLFQTTKAQSYTAKQGSSGSTKDKK